MDQTTNTIRIRNEFISLIDIGVKWRTAKRNGPAPFSTRVLSLNADEGATSASSKIGSYWVNVCIAGEKRLLSLRA